MPVTSVKVQFSIGNFPCSRASDNFPFSIFSGRAVVPPLPFAPLKGMLKTNEASLGREEGDGVTRDHDQH